MEFAQRHAITDTCILVRDLEASIAFYRDKLGFALQRRAPGFADFTGAGHTLALWERTHIAANTGVPVDLDASAGVLIAVRLPDAASLEAVYAELCAKDVAFIRPPANYPWNARCVYFAGPDGELWELYAWLAGGALGDIARDVAPRQ
ncbi:MULTISPECIES: VOC family protein [unclassified Bradyrhizobium]|uniref:VOC family protein n=1 Tax=unclassified Bradyrhizobium TaxID=2631580 RepID=UPI0023053F60|nr:MULTISPECIES: VOC family protein [unclassified Bradyrhizobium]MDA9405649.1 lactoylglutathione lyase [Bradyrhizobium sp. CCBAU 45384]MDA9437922.1 lactoylglutathione lyase [Bradyrhizobium sp. CCBAU 51745]